MSDSIDRQRMFLLTLLCCATLIALHGIHQAHNGGVGITGIEALHGRIAWVGFYEDPNDLGVLLVCAVPIAVYFALHGRRGSYLVGLLSLPALLYAVFLTGSRGALLATLFLGGVAGARRFGLLKTALLSLPIIAVVLSLPTRLDTISVNEGSAQGRVYAWYAGFLMFFEHPIFGVGPNQFLDYHFRSAHNAFVKVLAETGLIGYLLYMTLIASSATLSLWIGRQRVRFEPGSEQRQICEIGDLLFLIIASWIVGAFFLSVTYYPLTFTVLGLCAGHFLAAVKSPDLAQELEKQIRWSRWITIAAVSMPLLYVVTRILNRLL